MAYCVKLSGEDLSRYSNNIESFWFSYCTQISSTTSAATTVYWTVP